METKTYLNRYLSTLDQYGQPIKLRSNGKATTYKGFDAESNREVSIETIPAGSVRLSVQSKLEAEAEAAKQIKQINIPRLYDFGIEDNELIYASEMVDGVSAEQWVKTQGPMPIGSALRIASQVVNALAAATFHGIFHHALNPANVMIVPGQTAEGEWPLIKVMNFIGLAPTPSPATGPADGAPDEINYVAPEQTETGTADFRSEIYSLGCTLWFLLSGVPPLAGAVTVESASRVPSVVRGLLSQMLAVEPRDRPFDPLALHAQIEDCIAEVENKSVAPPAKPKVAAPIAAPLPIPAIDARPRRPFPWQPLAVAAVLLALAGVAAMVLPQRLHAVRGRRAAIGVPIGVPERTAAAAASNVSTRATAAAPATTAQPDTPRGTQIAGATPTTSAQPNTPRGTQIAGATPGVLTPFPRSESRESSPPSADVNVTERAPSLSPQVAARGTPVPVQRSQTPPATRSTQQTSAPVVASSSPASTQNAMPAPQRTTAPVVTSSSPAANQALPPQQPSPAALASNSPVPALTASPSAAQTTAPAVAANTPKPAPSVTVAQQTREPAVASNFPARTQLAEPAPPSEGPAEETTGSAPATQSGTSYANASPDGNEPVSQQPSPSASEPTLLASSGDAAAAETKPPEKTKAVAKTTASPAKKQRVAAAGPSLPRGSVRAQFLGTTPGGELIFGLPSDQRGYAAPDSAAPRRESSSRRRDRRQSVRPAEPVADLRVLPALPPDE